MVLIVGVGAEGHRRVKVEGDTALDSHLHIEDPIGHLACDHRCDHKLVMGRDDVRVIDCHTVQGDSLATLSCCRET